MGGLGFIGLGWLWAIHTLLSLNGQLVFKDPTHLLPTQTQPNPSI
jgi:hypothetical protein